MRKVGKHLSAIGLALALRANYLNTLIYRRRARL
jgi:hypothetical protein